MKMTVGIEIPEKNFRTCLVCGEMSGSQVENRDTGKGVLACWQCQKCGVTNEFQAYVKTERSE